MAAFGAMLEAEAGDGSPKAEGAHDLTGLDRSTAETRQAAPGLWSGEPSRQGVRHPVLALQVADAMRAGPTAGTLDVALHPEELGRVRLTFTPAEAGLSVIIHAERADTLDLLRRHIDLLQNDLRENGYGEVSFSFGQGGGESAQDARAAPSPPQPDSPGPEAPEAGAPHLRGASQGSGGGAETSGLDIRL